MRLETGLEIDLTASDLGISVPHGAKVYHCEEALTLRQAQVAVVRHLGWGHFILSCTVYGYHYGVDGTLVIARTGYSHS